jgi:antitoxin HicB
MARTKKKPGPEHRYPIELEWSEEDDAYLARVVDLPGCIADGETEREAIDAARVAARLWLEVATEEGRTIPAPSTEVPASGKFVARLPVSLHRRLQRMATRDKVSLNTLVVSLLSEREAERRAALKAS